MEGDGTIHTMSLSQRKYIRPLQTVVEVRTGNDSNRFLPFSLCTRQERCNHHVAEETSSYTATMASIHFIHTAGARQPLSTCFHMLRSYIYLSSASNFRQLPFHNITHSSQPTSECTPQRGSTPSTRSWTYIHSIIDTPIYQYGLLQQHQV